MTIYDMTNSMLVALGILGGILAQTTTTAAPDGIVSSLIQFGAIGAILLWITWVDIPNRNKAHADAVKAWQEAHATAVAQSKQQLVDERAAARAEREAADARLTKVIEAHEQMIERQVEATRRIAEAFDRDRTERRTKGATA